MSSLIIKHPTKTIHGSISLPTSKSISNRLLVLQKIIGTPEIIHQLSDSEDTRLMRQALTQRTGQINVNHAGTCLRFLTAYFACLPEADIVLSGSERLHQRPMAPLVNALKKLGAEIHYIDKVGFAPLHIKGQKLQGGAIDLDASISSQFVSALMLIAPVLEEGLTIKQLGKVVSKPYLRMTAKLLEQLGVECLLTTDVAIKPLKQMPPPQSVTVEKDWSGAGFWYVMAAISKQCNLHLSELSIKTIQGDAVIARLMEDFGVKSLELETGIKLILEHKKSPHLYIDMLDCPDLLPPMAVTMCALNNAATFTNVAHLQAKESQRLTALCRELSKCGFNISHTENELMIKETNEQAIQSPEYFNTYNDHRMAMSFALLALKFDQVVINNAEVVEKSYPTFWDDLATVGFQITTVADNS